MEKAKIMIVDDEIEILEIFRHIFYRDYQVFTAKNGVEALNILKNNTLHVVITDIKMPGITGVELLKKIKELSPQTEVIMMTGFATLESSIDALRFGAFDYLLKPFDAVEKVKTVINKALEKIKLNSETKFKQEELKRRAFELANIYDISKGIANFIDYEELLYLILNGLHKMIDYDFGVGIFYSSRGEKFALKNYSNVSDKYLTEIKHHVVNISDDVFNEDIKNLDFKKFSSDCEKNGLIKEKPEYFTWTPIIASEKPVGFIFLTRGGENFSEEDKKFLNSIAQHAGGELTKRSSIFSSDQKKIQTFVDALPSGVIMLNKNCELVMLNSPAIEILNLLGISLPKQWGKNYCSCHICKIINECFNDKKEFTGEIKTENSFLSVNAVPLTETDNSFSGIALILKDLTKESQLREQLIQLERLSSVGQLISGVAHELNNPLTGVLGYAEMLMKSELDGNIKNNLEKISTQAERCRKIIQNLLGFVRKHKEEMQNMNVNPIILTSLSLREYELGVRNIKLLKELESDLPSILGDGHRLQQVIINLIINAEQAMTLSGKGDTIKVKTACEEGNIVIYIQDNGPGIPDNIINKIFEPFFTTKETGKGTGLGLSISKSIIEEHGGEIKISSSKEGTSFIIKIPANKNYTEITEETGPSDIKIVRTGDKKILVVDDEPVIIDMITNVLEEFGHKVTTFDNGEAALQKIEEEQDFDLIILDMKMPGLGGKELYFIIKERFTPLAEKIIFSTGDIINPYTQAFLKEIGNRYVEKPFLLSKFQQLVDEMLYLRN